MADALLTLWRKDLPAPADETSRMQLTGMALAVLDGHVRNITRGRRRQEAMLHRLCRELRPEGPPRVDHRWSADLRARCREVLSEQDTRLVVLRCEGFSIAEIALVLGCSYDAAAKRSSRVLQRLRTHLAPVQHPQPPVDVQIGRAADIYPHAEPHRARRSPLTQKKETSS